MSNNKLANYISYAILAVAFVIIVVVTYWLAYPYKTVVFHNSPFPLGKATFKHGERLPIYTEYTRYTDIPVTVIARFTNSMTFSIPERMFQKRPGEYKETSMSYTVPDCLFPGKYTLEFIFNYDVNPLRTIVVTARTQEFEVVDDECGPKK